VARRRLGFWQRLAVYLVIPTMTVLTRYTWHNQENIPAEGGVILVANHVSHFDPLVVAHYVYKSGRWPRFLGKASLWRVPGVGLMLRRTQQIPVERGSVEAVKSLDLLVQAIRSGGAVIIYPEGTTTREPDLWPMRGKTGAARLALLTGAPVIPMANWGAHTIYDPRTSKLKIRPRTRVSVITAPPIDLSRWQDATPSRAVLEQMSDAIMLEVQDLLGELRGEQPPAEFHPRPVRSALPGDLPGTAA